MMFVSGAQAYLNDIYLYIFIRHRYSGQAMPAPALCGPLEVTVAPLVPSYIHPVYYATIMAPVTRFCCVFFLKNDINIVLISTKDCQKNQPHVIVH